MSDGMSTGFGKGVGSRAHERADDEKTTLDQAGHFSLYLLRAVMDGRGRELIDLARTNLRV